MATAASVVLDRARTILVDPAKTRWPDAELLKWASDGQRAIVIADPSSTATAVTLTLVAGTRQAGPADAHIMLSFERNNGAANGSIPGRVVRIISRELMDNFNPDWHSAPAKPVVLSVMFDPNLPRNFYVSPPNDATGYLDVVYSKVPVELAVVSDNLTVADTYLSALVDYVLYRAYSKDSDASPAQALAGTFLQSFLAALSVDAQGRLAANPNLALTPPDMAVKGAAK